MPKVRDLITRILVWENYWKSSSPSFFTKIDPFFSLVFPVFLPFAEDFLCRKVDKYKGFRVFEPLSVLRILNDSCRGAEKLLDFDFWGKTKGRDLVLVIINIRFPDIRIYKHNILIQYLNLQSWIICFCGIFTIVIRYIWITKSMGLDLWKHNYSHHLRDV